MSQIYFQRNGENIVETSSKFKKLFERYSKHPIETYIEVLRQINIRGKEYTDAIVQLRKILGTGHISSDIDISHIFITAKMSGIHLCVSDIENLHLITDEALTLDLCLDIVNLVVGKKLSFTDNEFYTSCKIIKTPNIAKYLKSLSLGDFVVLLEKSNGNKHIFDLVKDIKDYGPIKYVNILRSLCVKKISLNQIKIIIAFLRPTLHIHIQNYFLFFSLLASIDFDYLEIEEEFIEDITDEIKKSNLPITVVMLKKFFLNIYRDGTKILSLQNKISTIIKSNCSFFIAMVVAFNADGFNWDLIEILESFDFKLVIEVFGTSILKIFTHGSLFINTEKQNMIMLFCKELYKHYMLSLFNIEISGVNCLEMSDFICETGSLTKCAIKRM